MYQIVTSALLKLIPIEGLGNFNKFLPFSCTIIYLNILNMVQKEKFGVVELGMELVILAVLLDINIACWCYTAAQLHHTKNSTLLTQRVRSHECILRVTPSNVASSRRSVSWSAAQKTVCQKIKKAWRKEGKECLWTNLTKGPSAYFLTTYRDL